MSKGVFHFVSFFFLATTLTYMPLFATETQPIARTKTVAIHFGPGPDGQTRKSHSKSYRHFRRGNHRQSFDCHKFRLCACVQPPA